MQREAHELVARLTFRHLEDVPVRGAPDCLHHVPEVVAREAELGVPLVCDREQRRTHTTMAAHDRAHSARQRTRVAP